MKTSFSYLQQGVKLISQPGLRRYVIAPLAVNIILFMGFIALLFHLFGELNQWLNQHLPSYLHFMDIFVWLLFMIVVFGFLLYGFTLLANLIAAPFNGLLAERVQITLGHPPVSSQSGIRHHFANALKRQWHVIRYYLPRAFIFLILFFIPGVNLIASIAWLFFSSWMMTVQYLDYAVDNNQLPFSTTLTLAKADRWSSLSLGGLIWGLGLIPLINLVVMPIAVAGATVYYVEHHETIH